jgi:hypothetical protein
LRAPAAPALAASCSRITFTKCSSSFFFNDFSFSRRARKGAPKSLFLKTNFSEKTSFSLDPLGAFL